MAQDKLYDLKKGETASEKPTDPTDVGGKAVAQTRFVIYYLKHTEAQVAVILPPLCPSVLKPGLNLCIRHLQGLGQGGALSRGQVLLSVKTFLQLTDLHPAEGSAWFFPLGRRPVLIWVANTAGHREGREGSCSEKEKKMVEFI